MSEKNPKSITTIGGQALLEGLLMIGPQKYSIAIRKPDGEILVETEDTPPKSKLTKLPIIRGSVLLFKQLKLGMKAIMKSAEYIDIEEEEDAKPSKVDQFLENLFKDKLKDVLIIFAVIVSLAFSVGLFMLLPNLLAELLHFDKNGLKGSIIYNLFEGVIRVGLFFLYIVIVSKFSKDIRRVWQYHGAEHKTIHCFENGDELTIENVKKYTTRHPRCGTSFLFTVMVISIIVFSLAGWHHPVINLLIRLALLPVVAGISYEAFKVAGKSTGKIASIIKAPGLLFQKYTTSDPDDDQIEVAIKAMKAVM